MSNNSNENLLLKIEASLKNLRPSEQKVAEYVLENNEKVKFQTVSELAANSDVSEASVMRFVKSLGFKGFQYFKLSLASSTQKNNTFTEVKEITSKDSISEIMLKIKNNSTNSVDDTEILLKEEEIKKAIKYIKNASEILLVGVGASGIMAQLFKYKLLRLGIKASHVSCSHLQAMHASLIDSEGLIIGISHSGSTKDTVESMKIAKNSGARTICITAHLKSPIVRYSDLLLCTYSRKNPLGFSQGWSSTSQLFVIEILTAALYARTKKQASKAFKNTAESVLKKLY